MVPGTVFRVWSLFIVNVTAHHVLAKTLIFLSRFSLRKPLGNSIFTGNPDWPIPQNLFTLIFLSQSFHGSEVETGISRNFAAIPPFKFDPEFLNRILRKRSEKALSFEAENMFFDLKKLMRFVLTKCLMYTLRVYKRALLFPSTDWQIDSAEQT